MNGGVCCFGKESDSEFNTCLTALKGEVLNPLHTINESDICVLIGSVLRPREADSCFQYCVVFTVLAKRKTQNWKNAKP
jgi:hypothetical protein